MGAGTATAARHVACPAARSYGAGRGMSPLSPLVPASGAVLPPLLPREWRGACSAAKALSHVVRICDSGWLLFFIRSSSSGYLDKDTLRRLPVFFLFRGSSSGYLSIE